MKEHNYTYNKWRENQVEIMVIEKWAGVDYWFHLIQDKVMSPFLAGG